VDSGRILVVRRLSVGSLAAAFEDAEVRTPHLRVALRRGRNVTNDYALLGRAIPVAHRQTRPQISILLSGAGRTDENGRRVWMEAGDFVVSDGGAERGGSGAYSGTDLRQLLVEWDPTVFGLAYDRAFEASSVSQSDRSRLEQAALRAVCEETSPSGIVELLAVLRSIGLPLERVDARGLGPAPAALYALHRSVAARLSNLQDFPSIDDVAGDLNWNQRRIHRAIKSLGEAYGLQWSDWRTGLHIYRMLSATRLVSIPGATTELVARLTGFRSPTSLCHAFAKAGLPSPGALAARARGSALENWVDQALLPSAAE
jgi:hypothetical protein